jgi:hypothetical protein
MKRCSRCLAYKHESGFTKNKQTRDSLNVYCRDCTRILGKEYFHKYHSKRTESIKRYKETERGREVSIRGYRNYIKSNPYKFLAHASVRSAIKLGIMNIEPCMVCGELEVEAHHEDYQRPYDVKWLCKKHHVERHQELKHINKLESLD